MVCLWVGIGLVEGLGLERESYGFVVFFSFFVEPHAAINDCSLLFIFAVAADWSVVVRRRL